MQHRLHSLPPGVTDPNTNLPSGWEVWDEGGTYTYYNVIEDGYERPTTVHPFYGDVRTAEAIAADAALEALVAGAEAPFLPLDGPDEGEVHAGRWAAASTARCRKPRRAPGTRRPTAISRRSAIASTRPWTRWRRTRSRTRRSSAAASTPRSTRSRLGRTAVPPRPRGTRSGRRRRRPRRRRRTHLRALDLFASALTDEQLEDLEASQEDEQRIIGLDGRPLDADDAADSMPTAAVDVEDFLDFIEEQEEEEIEFYDERLGVVPSHELIEVDEDGDPITETARMTYVDEATCVGCTLCAGIAPSTFQMTDDHGRARVFNQEGEDEETITEAISTCPVSCIHFVPWDELVRLEKERAEVMTAYNFKSRLVGNDGFLYAEGTRGHVAGHFYQQYVAVQQLPVQ